MQVLQEGIEGFLKAHRKLPKQVRSMPVAYHLETKMKAFRDSIPLLLDLKNEALRERFDSISVRDFLYKQGYLFLFVKIFHDRCWNHTNSFGLWTIIADVHLISLHSFMQHKQIFCVFIVKDQVLF